MIPKGICAATEPHYVIANEIFDDNYLQTQVFLNLPGKIFIC